MNDTVYLAGRRISLLPSQAIGKGGEADIYNLGNGEVLKLYKPPDHPDLMGFSQEQLGAIERLREIQTKLRQFPKDLPDKVITPTALATDSSGRQVLGYSMHYLQGAEVLKRYSEQLFRKSVDGNIVLDIFRDLHPTVKRLHAANVVIGDFNDLNVLVLNNQAYLVDADSMQFGKYPCRVFTAKFVDPLLCDPLLKSPELIRPHTEDSDWYAYAVMLMLCLLFVDPYGGIYRPKDRTKRIPHGQRPLQRISIFHPEVLYPKPAIPYAYLSDELQEYFSGTFTKDIRGEFPLDLLHSLRWTKCSNCGIEHARKACPACSTPLPETVKQKTIIRGRVMANRFFRTKGQIMFATHQNDELLWLYQEEGRFIREDGSLVASLEPDPLFRFRIQKEKTLVGKGSRLISFSPDTSPTFLPPIDSFGTLAVFDSTADATFWVQNGQLLRTGFLGPEYIGDVLKGQTLFWVGPTFGFGFYRAGGLSVAFVFDAKRKGMNDSVKLPRLRGQLVDSTCFFSRDRAWFFVSLKIGSKTENLCIVVRPDGSVEALADAEEGDGTWLGTLRGKCAVGNFLLAATDEGVVRVETVNGQLSVTRSFPDTEPFVSSGSHLFPAADGIYVVSSQEITLLRLL